MLPGVQYLENPCFIHFVYFDFGYFRQKGKSTPCCGQKKSLLFSFIRKYNFMHVLQERSEGLNLFLSFIDREKPLRHVHWSILFDFFNDKCKNLEPETT